MKKDGNHVLFHFRKEKIRVLVFGSKDWTDYKPEVGEGVNDLGGLENDN